MNNKENSPVSLEGWFSESSPRGLNYSNAMETVSSGTLKSGLSLQFLALFGLTATHWLGGNMNFFTFEVMTFADSNSSGIFYYFILAVLQLAYVLGITFIATYRCFLSDCSKFSRGFRAGSKVLSSSILLSLVANLLRFVSYCYAFGFYNFRWWSRFSTSKGDAIIFNFATMLDGISNVGIGSSFLLLDIFHDEGTTDESRVWKIFTFYTVGGISELIFGITNFGAFYTLLLLAGHSLALLWAHDFEKVVEFSGPTLHSRDLHTNVVPKSMSNMFSSTNPTQTEG